MKREEIADLMAFVVVAEERSFTRAAARLSMAQSALSQIVRRIEERLGLRLLTRTTRSVDNTYYYCRTCSKNDIVTSNAHIPEIAS